MSIVHAQNVQVVLDEETDILPPPPKAYEKHNVVLDEGIGETPPPQVDVECNAGNIVNFARGVYFLVKTVSLIPFMIIFED